MINLDRAKNFYNEDKATAWIIFFFVFGVTVLCFGLAFDILWMSLVGMSLELVSGAIVWKERE